MPQLVDAADEVRWYGRADHQFYHQRSTKEAIVELAKAKVLVIYCGAGVTIDRTGLSWRELVSQLLLQQLLEEGKTQARPHFEEAAGRHLDLLGRNMTPQQIASILDEIRSARAESSASKSSQLIHRLQLLLYTDNGWQSGVLVRNIIRLATSFLELGRRVIIATTNFDEYLEKGLEAYRRETERAYADKGASAPKGPGIKVTALGSKKKVTVRDSPGNGQLELLYLHGRIPQGGAHSGRLVLGECDYHDAQDNVVQELLDCFRTPKAALLILGASMTDPPLLAALAASRNRKSRYALITAQSLGLTKASSSEDFEQLRGYVGRRGDHFGVRLLIPDFHYQVAQFCEEVLTAVTLAPQTEQYLEDRTGVRYGLRLVAWWGRWSQTDYFRKPDLVHRTLADGLRGVRDLLVRYGTKDRSSGSTERMKIELWVRDKPRTNRRLTLWGSSAGSLVDDTILRSEDLRLGSGNASMRAFVEGQPQYVAQETLISELQHRAVPLRRSRWESFLSVPIRVDEAPDGQAIGVPVGVLTLATMEKIRDSDIPNGSSTHMEEVTRVLTAVGQTILRA